MLPALRELLPWLVALYLLDSLVWVRPGLRLFGSRWLGGWTIRGPGLRLARGAPAGRAHLTDEDPVGLTADRVWVFVPGGDGEAHPSARFHADSYAAYPWREAARAEADDAWVRFPATGDGEKPRRVLLASPEAARERVETLRRLAPLSPVRRKAEIRRRSAARSDPEAVLTEAARWNDALLPVDVSGTVVFAGLFLLLPTAAYLLPWPVSARRLAIVLGALAVINASALVLTRRRLRRAGLLPPSGSLSSALFYPPAAAHPAAAVALHALAGFAATTVAVALLGDTRQVRDELRRALHGAGEALRTGPDDPSWRELWSGRRETAERLAGGLGLDLGALRSERGPHCPFCDAEIRAGIESCPDCRMALLGLDRDGS